MRISGGMRETAAIAHMFVAKWMISARRDFGRIIIETQSGHVAQVCTQM